MVKGVPLLSPKWQLDHNVGLSRGFEQGQMNLDVTSLATPPHDASNEKRRSSRARQSTSAEDVEATPSQDDEKVPASTIAQVQEASLE